ncbi:MAG: hypothetical protein FWG10_09645 [Eubacteriaceae bacterium]|nr:hypothetical protein [Eubacteriaceae bacterium]
MKCKSKILALILVAIFFCQSCGPVGQSGENQKKQIAEQVTLESFISSWTCNAESTDGINYVYTLNFSLPNEVIYSAGWSEGNLAAVYTGTYNLSEEGIILDMEGVDVASGGARNPIYGIFAFEITDDALFLTPQSGDPLTHRLGSGATMEFVRDGDKKSILGSWTCYAENGLGDSYVFTLSFSLPNEVAYSAGWRDSEMAAAFTGTYSINEEGITLVMEGIDLLADGGGGALDPIHGIFAFEITDDMLFLTLQSGDPLSYLFGSDATMEFARDRDIQSILGSWTCNAKSDEGDSLVFSLGFSPPNRVVYSAGWRDSELAVLYKGTYSISEARITLDMEGVDLQADGGGGALDPIHGIFAFEITDDMLFLTLQSGDPLSYLFGSDATMEFARDTTWENAYINFLFSATTDREMAQCALIYIDDDDIPELVVNFGAMADGAMVCTFNNGQISSASLFPYSLYYLERQNVFLDRAGRMDSYYDTVYAIIEGQFVDIAKGEYGAKDNTDVEYDSSGEPVYQYYWNGVEVEKVNYLELLNQVFPMQPSFSLVEGSGYMGFWETINAVRNYI